MILKTHNIPKNITQHPKYSSKYYSTLTIFLKILLNTDNIPQNITQLLQYSSNNISQNTTFLDIAKVTQFTGQEQWQ